MHQKFLIKQTSAIPSSEALNGENNKKLRFYVVFLLYILQLKKVPKIIWMVVLYSVSTGN